MAHTSFSLSVHAAPTHALVHDGDEDGVLHLRFGDRIYPDVALFTDKPALARDLAEAINTVIAKHAPQKAEAA